MSKSGHQMLYERMAKFLWSLKSEFPQLEVWLGVPPGFKYDRTWSEEEASRRTEEAITLMIGTENDPLSDEQQAEIRKRFAEEFLRFFNYTVTLHANKT